MCGRFTLTISQEELHEYLDVTFDYPMNSESLNVPRYNIAPSQKIIVIIYDGSQYRVGHLTWGYLPDFAEDVNSRYKMINVRSDSLQTKPFLKGALESKRCLIIADGFYEWQTIKKEKAPQRITLKNQIVFTMAGIWNAYKDQENQVHYTCAIVTTAANDQMKKIHERMPVILDDDEQKYWLEGSALDFLPLLKKEITQTLTINPVSKHVNSVKNDDKKCIEVI